MRLRGSRLWFTSLLLCAQQTSEDSVVRLRIDRVTQILDHSLYLACTFHLSACPFNMDRNLSMPYR